MFPNPHIPYEELCAEFNFSTLESRRELSDASFLFKIINNYSDVPDLLHNIKFKVPRLNSRYPIPFLIPHCNTDHNKNAPINRMCAKINQHPSIDIFSYNLIKFKSDARIIFA